MHGKIKILGIAGSLRKASYNRGLLEAAKDLLPPNCSLEIFDLKGLPLHNQDDEMNLPASVMFFKEKVAAADAILIATPENNYSIPAVLKNALDWGSRPYGQNAWDKKPTAIMGATPGFAGTTRAQHHLRQIGVGLNLQILCRPEVFVPLCQDKFDKEGTLLDAATKEKIGQLLAVLAEHVKLSNQR